MDKDSREPTLVFQLHGNAYSMVLTVPFRELAVQAVGVNYTYIAFHILQLQLITACCNKHTKQSIITLKCIPSIIHGSLSYTLVALHRPRALPPGA